MRPGKTILATTVLVTLAISLCACGDDDKDPASSFKEKTANAAGAAAQEEPDRTKDDAGFERDDNGFIISYDGGDKVIQIPDKIGRSDIVGIGYQAFKDNTAITEVKMPDTVTAVAAEAFSGCTKLESVTFSKNLASIDIHAFSDCESLSDVTLPDSCKGVADSAFSGSGRGTFKGSGAEYGNRCFEGSNFEKITFAQGADISGYGVFMDSGVKEIEFAPDAQEIGESAFANCRQVTAIILPDTVNKIGEGAFSNMGMLPELKLSEALTELPKDMTVGTETDVIIVPQSVKKICSQSIYDATQTVIQNPDVEIEENGVDSEFIYLAKANEFEFPSCGDDEVALECSRLYLEGVYSPDDIKGDFYNATSVGSQVYISADATEEESDAFDKFLVSIGYDEISWMAGILPEFLPKATNCFTMDDQTVTGCDAGGDVLSIPWYVLDEEDGSAVHRATFSIADGAFANSGFKTVFLHGDFYDGVGSGILKGNTALTDLWFNNAFVYCDMPDETFSEDSFAGIPENVTIHLPATLSDTLRSEAESYLHSVGVPESAKFDYYSL